MGFGSYGVRSGHTKSFIAGDRERPKAVIDQTTKKPAEAGLIAGIQSFFMWSTLFQNELLGFL